MQALVLADTLTYRTDFAEPVPAADAALIELSLAGICATDLELAQGYAGFRGIPGHEFVGRVVAVGDQQHNAWRQQRVVGSINIGCQTCPECLQHGPEHCAHRCVLGIRGQHGAFADYLTLPVRNLHPIADTVPDRAAVFTEPLAAALNVAEQLAQRPAGEIAVVGPGRLGLLIGKVLALAGHDVVMLGRTPASLALPAAWGLRTGLALDCPDNRFACVVDASGNAAGFAQALRLTRPRGTLVLKSTFAAGAALDLSKIVVAEITLLGSRCGPFAKALELLAQGDVPVETLIDGEYPLRDGVAAFAHAAQPGVRKILLSR
ncbi:alcohol dehydrogenase catalytic domain-containing protein [Methylomonas koyamae]|uniref:Zn-dependent alcohol dehydrogenase n=1 Tax=Methylomonas koyamae TaxID=702114 RepID=A0AA91DBB6_9GAMM|nr:alcohol dehydrogenase catalytic domain-containing protein [Methylomonas koyamae]OAI24797.1 Zn-dependent alcohol dehydrogenase [Methylomonas koyamae]